MPTKSLSSTTAGLATQGVYCPYDRTMVYISAPDWNSSKALQLWTAPTDTTADFVPEMVSTSDDSVFETSADGRVEILGPCFIRPYLTNPGTGVTIKVADPTTGIN